MCNVLIINDLSFSGMFKLSTIRYQLSTINYQLKTINYQLKKAPQYFGRFFNLRLKLLLFFNQHSRKLTHTFLISKNHFTIHPNRFYTCG
jgi:hypothetical protein